MPHILILGATGTIGNALALSLIRSGNHTVYGLARSPAKAKGLAVQEIVPVLGSVQEPQGFLDILEQRPEISVVVDAAAVYGESGKLLQLIVEAGKKRLAKYQEIGVPAGPKLGYVYVSGMWVHGSSHRTVSDQNPFVGTSASPTPPVNMVAWRPEIERQVISPETRSVLDTAVVRAALTYGGAAAIWTGPFATLLQAARAEPQPPTAQVQLDPLAAGVLAHVDDVASGIHALIEQLPLVATSGIYPVFDLASQVESIPAIMQAAARVFGYHGVVELVGPAEGDVFSEALGASVVADSGKAKTLLGWVPKRQGLLLGIEVYAQAWLAGFEKK
jgi:nucleoside-diphosphate-sugar epimerase